MQVKITGHTENKLAFVKKIKELTGMGLKESKEWCDDFYEIRNREDFSKTLEIDDRMTVEYYRMGLQDLGMDVAPARQDILAELLDNVYDSECEFIVICLNVKYNVVKGTYTVKDGFYKVEIEEGVRIFESEKTTIYNKTATLPVSSTIIEE